MAAVTDLEYLSVPEPTTVELRRMRPEELIRHLQPHRTQPLKFRYQRLRREGNIRLLKFSFTGTTREVSYEIIEKQLAEISGQFVAISYHWGILAPDRVLPIAGWKNYMLVTRVVERMLEHIVGDLDVPYIWIDAVCIDQNNNLEKNSQVSMMGTIFNCARSVRVWLGRSNEDLEESSLWLWLKMLLRPDLRRSMGATKNFAEVDEYLKLILEPQWYERIWVIQEACLAQDLYFHFGKIIISMDSLHDVVVRRLEYPHTSALVDRRQKGPNDFLLASFGVLQEIHTIRVFVKKRSGERLRSLSELYGSFASQKATNARDHIYGLLGLIHQPCLGGIQPDYNASVASTYIDATFRMIDAQGELSILGFAGLARATTGFGPPRRLPTWVPDFSEPPIADTWSRLKVFKVSPRKMIPATFSLIEASGSHITINPQLLHSRASIPAPFGDTDMFGCLSLTAIVFGTVAGIGLWPKKFENGAVKMNKWKNMYQTFREAYKMAEDLVTYSTAESASSLCWKTLIANLDGVDLATSAMFEDAKAFVADLMGLSGLTAFEQREERISMAFSSLWPDDKEAEFYARSRQEKRQNKYAESFARSGAGHFRRIFWTDKGYMGLAADGVRPGDLLCTFPGARVPFLIRGPVALLFGQDGRHYYHLISEAYVHGVMNGELGQNLNHITLYII